MTVRGAAVQTAVSYHEAWTSHDVDRAMTYVADDIVCEAPGGPLEGVEAFRGFMGPFVDTLQSANLLAAFGDDERAVVVYDTTTATVSGTAPGAELVTVRDGKIRHMKIIFDRLPFAEARRAQSS
jgi:ketosteroid isomerase-like protein